MFHVEHDGFHFCWDLEICNMFHVKQPRAYWFLEKIKRVEGTPA